MAAALAETPTPDEPETEPTGRAMDAELRVMGRLLRMLDDLPNEAAKRRAVAWFADRFAEGRP